MTIGSKTVEGSNERRNLLSKAYRHQYLRQLVRPGTILSKDPKISKPFTSHIHVMIKDVERSR